MEIEVATPKKKVPKRRGNVRIGKFEEIISK